MAKRSRKSPAPLATGKTARTQMRYLMMVGRGAYMEKVRKGQVKYDPKILDRFTMEGDAK